MTSTSSVASSPSQSKHPYLLTILGPTATGKTALATELAYRLSGEIISADSRQVFRGMDIGSGKDLADYHVHNTDIPYHLIDIHEAGYEYNVYQFVADYVAAYEQIVQRGHQPILCGGTGLYIDAVVRDYQLSNAPVDEDFRKSIAACSDEELTERLASFIRLHNHTDTETRERLVRALEIQTYRASHPEDCQHLPDVQHIIIGVSIPRQVAIGRIERRLDERLQAGMIEEVQRLLEQGVPTERLLRYGLEYKHVALHLAGQCSYASMRESLFTDIRRFAKRQMTWFRRMERGGVRIHWIDGTASMEDKVSSVLAVIAEAKKS